MVYIKNLSQLTINDIELVGGKNASLGEMIGQLSKKGIRVPGGFALTSQAYWLHIQENKLEQPLKALFKGYKKNIPLPELKRIGKKARQLIESAEFPEVLQKEIIKAYEQLNKTVKQKEISVAVRSSATAEDLPNASFAGQQDTFLNITGEKQLIDACKKSMASLFTDRAIMYRIEKGFNHFSVALSVCVQQMIRSDKASAGVMFTLDTESGFKDTIVITSSYGLGESVVQGDVVPDEFHVFKTALKNKKRPLIKKVLGYKERERLFGSVKHPVKVQKVSPARAAQFSLTDDEVFELAGYGLVIEEYYSSIKGHWSPMDIEWAKDGIDGKLYIVQARPETVHALQRVQKEFKTYKVEGIKTAPLLVEGQSIGSMAATGRACIVKTAKEGMKVKKGDIIVTRMTDPDWVPLMKKAAGIITESGGRTCHAAIVSRELGIPAIVGAKDALKKIQQGAFITMDCSSGSDGFVYGKKLKIKKENIAVKVDKKLSSELLVNCASPDQAYTLSHLPVDGVGLARLEFIITNEIQVHPMACIEEKKVDAKTRKAIKQLSAGYASSSEFFTQKIAEGVGMVAAAFYPRKVVVRFSDFKSNEYRNLIGGSFFEPVEENPMIGLRGASRYYHPLYAPAFELECKALAHVRKIMGLDNVIVMLPFVRTLREAQTVLKILKKHGLQSGKDGLKIYMMCELPSNVILIDQFAELFDGFSIGSNDLTQTTLSVDRDSGLLVDLFDERDPAVKYMLKEAIRGAKKAKKPIGICGQAPSDHPELAEYLLEQKITSLSLNADSVLPFLNRFS